MLPHHNLTGLEVGAKRWAYHGSHPGCWLTPWKGTVLKLDDPKAWTGTIAFPGIPTQEEVTAHIEYCLSHGLLKDRIPVMWQFDKEQKVFWESASNLRPYAEDVADWERERAAAIIREQQRKAA